KMRPSSLKASITAGFPGPGKLVRSHLLSTATPHAEAGGKLAFFKQSGWMVMATVGGGVFMMLVHNVAARMDKEEYGVFFALLRCLILLGIPAGGLQFTFAQQTAASLNDQHHYQLAATTRAVCAAC